MGVLVSGLPVDFPVPLVLVQHVGAAPSVLVDILRRKTPLSVQWAQEGLRPRPRTLYVAPPDRHLEFDARRTFRLSPGPKVHFTRPAADPLLTSAARVYGRRTLGVILTGAGQDGAMGARAIRHVEGLVLVQRMGAGLGYSMPGTVKSRGDAHFVLPLEAMAPALISLVMVPGATALFGIPAPQAP
jgi:two-component system, chemotaxis family, protein-glutamate methylesterase/glutaminase